MELFKIGCLEFCMNKSYFESEKTGLKKGVNVIEVHIAHGSKITPENVDKSLYEAGYVDGIRNRWQELWFITLPSLGPQLLFSAVMQIQASFAAGTVAG